MGQGFEFQPGILQKVSDAVIITDPDYYILNWNYAAEQIYGWTMDEVVGRRVENIVATELSGKQREQFRRNFTVQGIWKGEVIQHHKDGHAINISATVTMVRDKAERIIAIVAVNQDITLRKKLEQMIIDLSEYEQQRIGRDLHDGLGSRLSGLAMLSRSLAVRHRRGETIRSSELEELADLLSQGAEEAQILARNLNPVWKERLADALQYLADTTQILSGIPCIFQSEPDVPSLQSEVANHLYRIAQEAVNNAVKHSRATLITINLRYLRPEEWLLLQIADDGIGISLKLSGGRKGGMGLHTMEYRASLIGATFTITSSEGGGTVISCRVIFPATSIQPDTTEDTSAHP